MMIVPSQSTDSVKTVKQQALTFLTVALSTIALLLSGSAAAEWQFDPVLRAAWDYDDNATLSGRTDQEIELSGYIAEASIDFVYNSDNSFLSIRPIARTSEYGSNSEFNADDQFLRIYGVFDGEKNSFRILGDASREAVRTAEIADAGLETDIDPDDIEDDQSGIGFINQRRYRYQFSPRWTYNFSDISSIETDFSYLTVEYEETEDPISLFDFTDMRLRFSYRRRFSPRSTALISAAARDYDTDRFGEDRQTVGISVGFVQALSETTQFRAQVGVESIDQEDVGQGTIDTDPQPVFEISFVRRLKTIHLLAQYRQRIAATGRGDLTQRDEVNLRFTRDLNDRFSAGLGVRAYNYKAIDGLVNEQNYVQLRGQVVWRISRTFSFQADYRHTVIERDSLAGAADSNRFTLWLSYQPNPVRRDPRLNLRF